MIPYTWVAMDHIEVDVCPIVIVHGFDQVEVVLVSLTGLTFL